MKLGAHISIAGGFHKALLKAQKIGCNVVQFFLKNNNRWLGSFLQQDDIILFNNLRQSGSFKEMIGHSGYLANLASPSKENLKKSINSIMDDILRCNILGVNSLIIHPGSHLGIGIDIGIRNLASSLNVIHEAAPKIKILIETSAGSGNQICYKFSQIAKVMEAAKNDIGVCIDTCHIFAAGYQIHTERGFDATIKEIEQTVGLNSIKVIHLNDSKYKCNCRIDRHQHIGKGYIGNKAFKRIISLPKFKDIPFIIETPKEINGRGEDMDIINLTLLKKLAVISQ